MSSVSLSELILLFVIGLLILGPERLPRVASQIGRWVGRARRTANQLRYQLEREVALAEFEQTKKSAKKTDGKAGAATKSAGQPPGAAAGAAAPASGAAGDESGTAGAAAAEAGTAADTDADDGRA